jgi:hypothetical protein
MKTIIAWWNLDNSVQTIESLRIILKNESVEPWEKIEGLRIKLWISDPIHNLWGAVMLWESADFMNQPLPPNRATALIGYPPTLRYEFNVEETVERF